MTIAVALLAGLIGVPGAFAAPVTDPSTSHDAKAAWDASARQAEVASEQLAGATLAQTRAASAARAAAAALVKAKAAVVLSQQKAAAAEATVSGYQGRLDVFANASLRGAHLGEMSALLTSDNADDFLDKATSIDQVAADTQALLTQAVSARYTAETAEAAADTAESAAEQAKTTADAANVTAVAAAAAAQTRKADLDAAVAKYKALYAKLSDQERKAAEAAAAQARAESLARAEAAEAQAAREAAQAAALAAAKSSSSSSTSSSSSSPAAVAGTPASTGGNDSSSTSSTSTATSAPAATTGAGGDSLGQIAAKAAMTKIGGGYCYACDGPNSFDCSGLTTWAWAQAGISIPRVSYEQANFPEVPLDQLQPGDLVTYYSPVSHVAIYVGNGMVASAADEELGILYVPVNRAGPDATGHRVPRG